MAERPTPAPPGPRAGGALSGPGRNRTLLVGGGVAVVAVLALLKRSGAAAGSSTTAAAPTSTYDSTITDLENAYASLQARVDALTPTSGTPAGTTATGLGAPSGIRPIGPASPTPGGRPLRFGGSGWTMNAEPASGSSAGFTQAWAQTLRSR